MKKLTLITIILVFAFSLSSNAQRWKRVRYEVLYGIGASNAMTELGGADQDGSKFLKDLEISKTRPVIYGGVRYKFSEVLATKVTLAVTMVSGDDALTNAESRNNRNISFTSPLVEFAVQGEWSIIKERLGSRYTFSNMRRFKLGHVNTYLFGGVGGFFFSPKTNTDDMPTSKNESYGKVSVAFPMGIGFKYGINRRLSFGMEIGPRLTLTDYLDGISDINSKGNDSYMFLLFSLNYKLKTARSGLPRF